MNVDAAKKEKIFYPGLEIGRGIAALLVVLFHLEASQLKYFSSYGMGHFFASGYSGVEFFFLLSGFIIFEQHATDIGRPRAARIFILKRAIRILPIFWLIVIPMAIAFLLIPTFGPERMMNISKTINDIFLIPREGVLLLPPAWSLQHEFVFYFIFGLAILFPRAGLSCLIAWQAICLINVVFSIYPYDYLLPVNKLIGYSNLGFGVGLLLALYGRNTFVEHRKKSILILGLSILLLMFLAEGLGYISVYENPAKTFVYYGAYSCILLFLLHVEFYENKIFYRWMLRLGAASYVLYLFHEPGTSVFIKLIFLMKLNTVLNATSFYWSAVAFSVIASLIIHSYIERPFLAILRRRFLLRHRIV